MAQPLKVWEIIPTLGGGGAEKMVLDLADGIQDAGHDVTVISLYDRVHAADNRVKFAEQNQIQIRYLDKKPGFDFHLLRELMRMIKCEKPDIIHTHIESFQYLAIASMFCEFNHVHTMHSIVGKESKIYQYLLRNVSKRKRTYFVVLSEKIGDSMKETFGTDQACLTCIPNGIDRNIYKEKQRVFQEGPIHFIAVGSLIPVKNQSMLIDAFSRMQKERAFKDSLVILGEGVLRKALEEQVKKLNMNDRVALPGNVDDVLSYLDDADVYVMPSHFEGVSLALLEAASTGLPIITTRTGNTPEVVQDDAILIEDDDGDALCSEMKMIADNSEYRREYASKALNVASRFDKRKMVEEYINLYQRKLGRI